MRLGVTTLNSGGVLDKIGTAFSWVCAVHCLATPFVVSFVPLLSLSFIAEEGFEYVLIGISSAIGVISLLPSFLSRHKKLRTILFFISGISLIIFADVVFEESLPGKLIFVLLGAGFISLSHMINRRLCLSRQRGSNNRGVHCS